MNHTQKCPQCGAEIAASLVAAILDPKKEESCPKTPPPAETFDPVASFPEVRLAAYMLLGRMAS